MNNQNTLTSNSQSALFGASGVMQSENPYELLKTISDGQANITLALEQLKETQSALITTLDNSSGSSNAFGVAADVAGILSFADVLTEKTISGWIKSAALFALKQAVKHPIVATALATMAAFTGTFAFLEYQMQTGQIERPNMQQLNTTANAIDEIMAASNPHITPNVTTPAERGEMARQSFEKRKKSQANIAMALETLNNVSEIYAGFNPHVYSEPATFNDWQNQWLSTSDMQQRITYNNQKSQSSPSVTVNMTNTFPQHITNPYQVREIGDILADQLAARLNSGAPLCAPGW